MQFSVAATLVTMVVLLPAVIVGYLQPRVRGAVVAVVAIFSALSMSSSALSCDFFVSVPTHTRVVSRVSFGSYLKIR